MSIRKIVDLPFIQVNDPDLSSSFLEVSIPKSDDLRGQFESQSIQTADFKSFAVKEVAYKNTFPNGVCISSVAHIVDSLSVNTHPYSPRTVQIPYSKNYPTRVDINGIPLTLLSSSTEIDITSPDTRLYANDSDIHVMVDDDTSTALTISNSRKTGSSITIPSNVDVICNTIPQIVAGKYSILADSDNQLNVDAMLAGYDALRNQYFGSKNFGRLAKYDYKIVSSIPTGRSIQSNCFYFVTSNIY